MKRTNLLLPGGMPALSVLSVGLLVFALGAPAFGQAHGILAAVSLFKRRRPPVCSRSPQHSR